jgi:membrane associated rhomboid family serine protease
VGIYDRDYYRQERPGFFLAMPRSAVVTLILVNVAVYLADALFGGPFHQIDDLLSARVGTLTHPLYWWQFLTYGFVHDPKSLSHIVFNMLALWFLGREVENRYGTAEFTRLYLLLLVVGGVAWAVIGKLTGLHDGASVIGASGAIAGIVVLFALNFPRRIILFMFFLPMPAWVLGVIIVVFDILGTLGQGARDVAYIVHLAGAAFAFIYFQKRWNFGRLLGGRFQWPRLRSRPRLRVHDPEELEADEGVPEEEVDRILEKIHREGEASLTRKERHILENASREYQRRRKLDV